MERYVKHASKNPELGDDLWWWWIALEGYRHPLPCGIINKIQTVHSRDLGAVFFVSDIVRVTASRSEYHKNTLIGGNNWRIIPMKRKTEICFLSIAVDADTLHQERLIIDAWRGPTFSDEEARLP